MIEAAAQPPAQPPAIASRHSQHSRTPAPAECAHAIRAVANGVECLARSRWLMRNRGFNASGALRIVASEFPQTCKALESCPDEVLSAGRRAEPEDSRTESRPPLTLVVGVSKCGTTSLANFFRCSGVRTSHLRCGPNDEQPCAHCVLRFLADLAAYPVLKPDMAARSVDHEPMFRRLCGPASAHAQIDYPWDCLHPQVTSLFSLVRALPRACFVLNTRPLDHWLASVRGYGAAGLYSNAVGARTVGEQYYRSCPIFPRNESGLRAWAERHVAVARQMLSDEARCWVEVDIEDPRAADVLASALPFTNRSCWGAHNVNARRRRGKPSTPAGAFEEEGESQSQSEDGEQ